MGTGWRRSALDVARLRGPAIDGHAEFPILGCLVIDVQTYRTHQRHHLLADQVMARYGYDPMDVVEMRLTEGMIEVDTLNRARPETSPEAGFAVVTHRHTP